MTTTFEKSLKKIYLDEMNAIEVKNKINKKTIAILVLGACENHGDHMPFGSDFIFPLKLVENVIEDISNNKNKLSIQDLQFIVLPAIPYGVSSHHNSFQMTMSLEASTLISIIIDLFSSLGKNGIRRILVINGHDGNISPIEIASRIIKNKIPDIVISCLEAWWVLVGQKNKDLFDVWNGLGHGGEAETSGMLFARPDLVDLSNAPNEIIPNLPGEDIRIYWKFDELTYSGSTGSPKKASLEKGEKIVEMLKETIISFINTMEKSEWKYGIEKN